LYSFLVAHVIDITEIVQLVVHCAAWSVTTTAPSVDCTSHLIALLYSVCVYLYLCAWIGWTNCTQCHWWWVAANWCPWSPCKHTHYTGTVESAPMF